MPPPPLPLLLPLLLPVRSLVRVAQDGRACALLMVQTPQRKSRTKCRLTRRARRDLHHPQTREDIAGGVAEEKEGP